MPGRTPDRFRLRSFAASFSSWHVFVDDSAPGLSTDLSAASTTRILGVDFTSAPSRRKPITVAVTQFSASCLTIERVDRAVDFSAFELMLATKGPWIGGFDFPFGLPREVVTACGWPESWPDLIGHIQYIRKDAFKRALNDLRKSRPYGSRYIARRGDAAAGSSSPMKLVNPPVGLMFFEGAPRLLKAGLSVAPCSLSADTRVAFEAYPGYLARKITTKSYKKDGKDGLSAQRVSVREQLVTALTSAAEVVSGIQVDLPSALRAVCIQDGSGDTLDAVMCAIQVAQHVATVGQHGALGIPKCADPLEGWIITVPDS